MLCSLWYLCFPWSKSSVGWDEEVFISQYHT
jgi:hypothetical protein